MCSEFDTVSGFEDDVWTCPIHHVVLLVMRRCPLCEEASERRDRAEAAVAERRRHPERAAAAVPVPDHSGFPWREIVGLSLLALVCAGTAWRLLMH